MRSVFALVLLFGVSLAGFAVWMAQSYLSTTAAERDALLAAQAAAVPTVQVYVVNRTVKYGEKLKPEDIQLIPWPENALPEGIFKGPEFRGEKDVSIFPEGAPQVRTVLRSIEKFEPILAIKVTEPGEDAGITSRLTKGMRAFAINVDVSSGVSGFLRPGDKVDVYWTGNSGQGDVTKLIQVGIRLIAIDQMADGDGADTTTIARTVTVEATPEQVAALAQAQSTGSLSLSLVGAEDTTESSAVQIDQNTLLGIEETAPVVAEEQKVCTIRTNKGGEIVETPIPCNS